MNVKAIFGSLTIVLPQSAQMKNGRCGYPQCMIYAFLEHIRNGHLFNAKACTDHCGRNLQLELPLFYMPLHVGTVFDELGWITI